MAGHAQDIAAALERVESVLPRRPAGRPARRRAGHGALGGRHRAWSPATPTAPQVPTDMPAELGGSGDQVTPGWLFRAGLASCTATCDRDARGGRGHRARARSRCARPAAPTRAACSAWRDADGRPVDAGPRDLQLHVRIAAAGVAAGAPARAGRAEPTAARRCPARSQNAAPLSCCRHRASAERLMDACRKPCASCAWSARSSSTPASPRPGATSRRAPTRRRRCWSPAPSGW